MSSVTDPSSAPTPSRRERLRREFLADIKQVGFRQLAQGGPSSITLRGIARELGVSPAALYSYVESLDDLFTHLITDGFEQLGEAVSSAIEHMAERPAGDRLLAGVTAYRLWALAHPHVFRLLYQEHIPGYAAPEDGPTVTAAMTVTAPFLQTLLAGWRSGELRAPDAGPFVDPTKLNQELGTDVTSDELRSAISCWGQFHGLVVLELGNGWGDDLDNDQLYESCMREMLAMRGGAEAGPDVVKEVAALM